MSISSISASHATAVRPMAIPQSRAEAAKEAETAQAPPANSATARIAVPEAADRARAMNRSVPLTDRAKVLAAKLHESAIERTPGAVDASSATHEAAEAPPEAGPMMTVEGLMAAWGQGGDSPYDITGDGVVDVSDLMSLLANGGTMPMPENYAEPMTVDGLMQAWGSDNAAYDFNGDGVVDVSDLLAMLSKLGASQGSDPVSKEKLAVSQLPAGVTADGLMQLARVSPAANDANIRSLMSLLGEGTA